MKKQIVLVAMLALFVISCSKHNDPPPTSNGYFRGKVDGVFFSDSTSAAISVPSAPRIGPMATDISGKYDSGVITLFLPPLVPIGERLLDSNSTTDVITIALFRGGEYFYVGWSRGVTGIIGQGSGKINILELTGGYMKGTFECIAPVGSTIVRPPMHITEGEFKLKIPPF